VKKLIISNLIIYNEKYDELISIANSKKVNIHLVSAGDKIYIDETEFYMIHPKTSFEDINENSLVVKLKFGNSEALFTGDISSNVEDYLTINKIDILKVAHHGSSCSSSFNFINKIKPKLSIISVGENNYGHPNINVINNLNKFGLSLSTKDYGEINVKMYYNGQIKYTKCIN
jgi:competence protein ComEC